MVTLDWPSPACAQTMSLLGLHNASQLLPGALGPRWVAHMSAPQLQACLKHSNVSQGLHPVYSLPLFRAPRQTCTC